MRVLVVAVVLLASIATARGEPVPPRRHKSVVLATALSGGATVVGAALVVGSTRLSEPGPSSAMFAMGGMTLLVGPSLGRIYASHPWSASLLVRAFGLGVMGIGEALASSCLGTEPGHSCPQNPPVSLAPMLLGGMIVTVGALWDVADTPDVVDRYNAEHAAGAGITILSLPTHTGTVPGLGIGGRF